MCVVSRLGRTRVRSASHLYHLYTPRYKWYLWCVYKHIYVHTHARADTATYVCTDIYTQYRYRLHNVPFII